MKWQADSIKNGVDLGPARGTITLTVPSDKRLGIYLNTQALMKPDLLDKITPNVVEGLVIQATAAGEDESEYERNAKVITHLGSFTHLKELFLDKSDITDAQLAGLPILKSLERFSAGSAVALTGSSLKRLSQLPNLNSISYRYTSFDGKNLEALKAFKKLETLDLAQTSLHEGLKYLTPCPSLKQLDIGSGRVTDEDLKYLLQLKNLEDLNLENCKISDKGLPALTGLKNLKVLNLQSTGVTISGIIGLSKNMHISRLYFTDRHFTPTQRQQLKDNCPAVLLVPAPRPAMPAKELQEIFAPVTRHGGLN